MENAVTEKTNSVITTSDRILFRKVNNVLELLQNQAWEALTHHKDQINKLVIWGGGLLITLIVASRAFGAIDTSSKAEAFNRLLYSVETVSVIYVAFLGLLSFVLHHHISVSFYTTMLKLLSRSYYAHNERVGSVFLSRSSPYKLYKKHLVKTKRIPGGTVHATNFGFFGVASFTSLVLLMLLMLTQQCIVTNLDVSDKIAGFISMSIIITIIGITITIYEKTRRKVNTSLEQDLNDLLKNVKELKINMPE